ncbi:MAG: hypothetical protein ACRD7E_21955, partial [Bryobacteraceae bacterium]
VASPSYFRRTISGLALRDQYEVSRKLTLSAGLNFEVVTPRVEKYDRQSTVDLTLINPANGKPGALAVAAKNGQRRAFQPVRARLEPSLGIAWTPGIDSSMVVRMSYGLSYTTIPAYFGQWGTQGFNAYQTYISPNVQLAPAVVLADGLPSVGNLPDLRPDAVNDTVADLMDPTARQPVLQNFTASVEREFAGSMVVTAGLKSYGGKNMLVGNSAANPNAIPIDALKYRDRLNDESFRRSLRPYPQYQSFDLNGLYPVARYERNAGFLRVEKRTSGGLGLTANYEFSKQMDDYSGPYGIQDFYNRENEWAMTAGSNPHRFSLSYVYELPMGRGRELFDFSDWRRYLVEGWSISGMTTINSGDPLALYPQFNNTGTVLRTLNVDVVPGVDPHVADQGPDLWFNPAAFAQPEDFTPGNASRTHPSLRNPSSRNHDLSLSKRFSLDAERTVELSAVGFNFINTANWNDPDTEIGPASAPNANAGKIIGSRGGRVVQLGIRYSF